MTTAPWPTLIIDDEPPSRRRLARLLESIGGVEIVGEASDVAGAVAALESRRIELIFLDVEMPGGNGFSLFERTDVRARVVFVTAYEQHAVRAFERDAVDYLVKPVDRGRLARTLARLGDPPATASERRSDEMLVCLPLAPGFRFVAAREIACVEAQGDYTLVRLRDGSEELVGWPLQRWEERLPTGSFARVHRGALVRLDLLDRLELHDGQWHARIRHVREPVPVSRAQLRALRDRFAL